MGRITAVPFGLQSLLGNTAFGDNPSELSPETESVLEQFPFLAQSKMDFVTDSSAVNSVGDNTIIAIPEGEFWIPINMAWFLSFTEVGTQHSVRMDLFNVPRQVFSGSVTHILDGGDIATSIAIGGQASRGYKFNDLFLLSHPVQFRAVIQNYLPTPAVTDGLNLYVHFYRLDA